MIAAGAPSSPALVRGLVRGRGRGLPVGPLVLWAALLLVLVLPLALFLLVAVSPRIFDQGTRWFTLSSFADALRGPTLQGLVDSLLVGVASSVDGLIVATGLAWLVQRTTLAARRLWTMLVWALLLAPSYLFAVGWERLVEPDGLLARYHLDPAWLLHLVMGPVGVVIVLSTRNVPFAFLAVSAALLGLGSEFEEAARVHGGTRWTSLRVVVPMLAPALWSGAAIGFAEAISDFGVASTLAADAHFPVATYTLFNAVDSMPIDFPVAAAVAWMLVAAGGLAVWAQRRALRGRSYAILHGRTRLGARHRLTPAGQALGLALAGGFFLIALGVPAFGAISASLLRDFGASFASHAWTLANYRRVLHHGGLTGPLLLSGRMATLAATASAVLGVVVARTLVRGSGTALGRFLDLVLIGAVAVPTIVLAAGYIFTYNLPALAGLGLDLYGTLAALAMGYVAGILPTLSRMLVGPAAQLRSSMVDAARVHGAGAVRSLRTVLVPLLARPLVWAWLFGFAGTLLELPISQLLYPPGEEPLSVAITKHLANYDFGGGTAMMVLSVVAALAVIGFVLGAFDLLSPRGWRRIGR